VRRVCLTEATILFELKLVRNCPLVFRGCIIALLTHCAS